MPRKSRIDTPGALHHIMARGIERRKIFNDDKDRNDFLDRLGNVLSETGTACYAWALMPNHFHVLIRTGNTPISTVMRRVLTGYAIGYNHRHHRSGHLLGIEPQDVVTSGKRRHEVEARDIVCFWSSKELGMSQVLLAGKFGVSQPAISVAIHRGEKIVNDRRFTFS